MERDLTSGSVWKNIVYFSLPYWSGSGSAGQPKGIESSGKYHRAFCWRLSGSSSRFTGSGAANRACDVHTGGSGRRNGAVSYDLFYRNPVYHRV